MAAVYLESKQRIIQITVASVVHSILIFHFIKPKMVS